MRKKSRHATTAEIIACNELLTKYCVKHDGGLCHYVEGQTDATIAAQIAPDLPPSSVAKIRKEMFGALVPPAAVPSARASDAILSEVLLRIATVEAALAAVCAAHNRAAVLTGDDSLCVSQGLINAIGGEHVTAR